MGLIQQIPQAILQSLGFMAILFLLFEGIQFWFKPSSNQKYWLACSLYGAALVHFLLEIVAVQVVVLPKLGVPIEFPNQLQWMTIIGILYLTILIGYLLFFLFRWMQLQQLQSNADFNSASQIDQWLELQAHNAGYKQKIKIGFSNQVDGPVTFGWLEPVILMPFSLLNQISAEEIKFILLHELAHILRNDFIIHLFVEIAQLILCFNPFSYYFSKIIRIEREKACDAWVVAQTKDPLLYTKALYQLAKYNYKNNHGLSLAAVDTGSELLLRIKQINGLMTPRSAFKNRLFKFVLGFGMSLFILLNLHLVTNKIADKQNLPIAQSGFPIQNIVTQKTASKQQIVRSELNNGITTKSTQTDIITEPYPSDSRKSFSNSTNVQNDTRANLQDSSYQKLIKATIAWIKERELKQNNEAVFANYDDNKAGNEYSVAEQLLLRAVLHKYELKRTILANAIAKANSQDEALSMIAQSKEWIELQQYEKWASRFLKQHPNLKDSSKDSDF